MTIAAGQSTASFNVVIPNGIGSVPEATLDVQISTNTGDTSTIVSPNAYVTVVNNTPEPGAVPAQAAFQLVSGVGALSQNGDTWTLDLGNYVEKSLGGQGEIAVANIGAANADGLTGSLTGAGDSGFTTNIVSKLGSLATGAIEDIATYSYDMTTVGTHTETLTLTPVDTNLSGYRGTQAVQTLTIEYDVVPPAQASVLPSTINFGQVRLTGSAVTQGLTIVNVGQPGAENLDASIGPATGSATGSGTVSELAQGATSVGTSGSGIEVGLADTTGGVETGTIAINLFSDGNGIDQTGISALLSQDVTVSGTVYALASPTITPPGTSTPMSAKTRDFRSGSRTARRTTATRKT